MMDDYRKDIDKLHAPEELIQKTLKTIDAYDANANGEKTVDFKERQKEPRRNRFRSRVLTTAAAAAAAVIIFTVALPSGSQYTITDIPAVTISREFSTRSSGSDYSESAASIEEYSDYVDMDCTSLLSEADYTSGTVMMEKDDNGDVSDDAGIFYYEEDGAQIMIMLSRTHSMTPDSMSDLKQSRIAGYKVILAQSGTDDNTSYYAAGEKDGISFYLYSSSSDEELFQDTIRNFLKK